VQDVLQSFQGAVLIYLVTGEPEPGEHMLNRLCKMLAPEIDTSRTQNRRRRVP
jgi:hypothetical protein